MSQPNLLTDKIPSLLWKIGLPAGIGFFFNTLFNITDAYWAGKLGVEAATAMSQTFPIFLLLIVFSNGLSSAASTLIGNALGSKNEKEVATFVQHIFFLSILLVIILTPLLLFFAPRLLLLTGVADPHVQALSLSYIVPILSFALLFLFSYTINGILNAYGDTKTYSRTLIVGAIINVALDPLLMFGIPGYFQGFGIAGVAWATVSIQLVSLLYMISVLRGRGTFALCCWTGWRPAWPVIREIFHIAIPASLSMIFVSVGIFVINAFLKDFGTNVMAVYGVGTRIEQIVLLPTIGLSIGASAIIAQNNGAKNFARVREAYKLSLLYGSLVVIPLAIAIWFLSDYLYPLFITSSNASTAAEILHLGRQYTSVVIGLFW
ncbi:MATE family efflux transporter [Candidatus Peribacteria bacterium]|nr:MATE family efflux transporter [Candidatus Peribacteria bacterium]